MAVDLVLADQLRDHDAHLGGAHRATHGQQHLAALGQVRLPALGCVDQGGSVEVTVVVNDEFFDGAHVGLAKRKRWRNQSPARSVVARGEPGLVRDAIEDRFAARKKNRLWPASSAEP